MAQPSSCRLAPDVSSSDATLPLQTFDGYDSVTAGQTRQMQSHSTWKPSSSSGFRSASGRPQAQPRFLSSSFSNSGIDDLPTYDNDDLDSKYRRAQALAASKNPSEGGRRSRTGDGHSHMPSKPKPVQEATSSRMANRKANEESYRSLNTNFKRHAPNGSPLPLPKRHRPDPELQLSRHDPRVIHGSDSEDDKGDVSADVRFFTRPMKEIRVPIEVKADNQYGSKVAADSPVGSRLPNPKHKFGSHGMISRHMEPAGGPEYASYVHDLRDRVPEHHGRSRLVCNPSKFQPQPELPAKTQSRLSSGSISKTVSNRRLLDDHLPTGSETLVQPIPRSHNVFDEHYGRQKSISFSKISGEIPSSNEDFCIQDVRRQSLFGQWEKHSDQPQRSIQPQGRPPVLSMRQSSSPEVNSDDDDSNAFEKRPPFDLHAISHGPSRSNRSENTQKFHSRATSTELDSGVTGQGAKLLEPAPQSVFQEDRGNFKVHQEGENISETLFVSDSSSLTEEDQATTNASATKVTNHRNGNSNSTAGLKKDYHTELVEVTDAECAEQDLEPEPETRISSAQSTVRPVIGNRMEPAEPSNDQQGENEPAQELTAPIADMGFATSNAEPHNAVPAVSSDQGTPTRSTSGKNVTSARIDKVIQSKPSRSQERPNDLQEPKKTEQLNSMTQSAAQDLFVKPGATSASNNQVIINNLNVPSELANHEFATSASTDEEERDRKAVERRDSGKIRDISKKMKSVDFSNPYNSIASKKKTLQPEAEKRAALDKFKKKASHIFGRSEDLEKETSTVKPDARDTVSRRHLEHRNRMSPESVTRDDREMMRLRVDEGLSWPDVYEKWQDVADNVTTFKSMMVRGKRLEKTWVKCAPSNAAGRMQGSKFTEEQDAALREVKLKYPNLIWKDILLMWEERVGSTGRSSGSLRKRWNHLEKHRKLEMASSWPTKRLDPDTNDFRNKKTATASEVNDFSSLEEFSEHGDIHTTASSRHDGRPQVSGKTIDEKYLKVLYDGLDQDDADTDMHLWEAPSDLTWFQYSEPEPLDEDDINHFSYFVQQKIIPAHESDADMVEWRKCSQEYEVLDEASVKASEVFLDLRETKFTRYSYEEVDLMPMFVGQNDFKTVMVRVQRHLLTHADDIMPKSNKGMMISRKDYVVKYRVTDCSIEKNQDPFAGSDLPVELKPVEDSGQTVEDVLDSSNLDHLFNDFEPDPEIDALFLGDDEGSGVPQLPVAASHGNINMVYHETDQAQAFSMADDSMADPCAVQQSTSEQDQVPSLQQTELKNTTLPRPSHPTMAHSGVTQSPSNTHYAILDQANRSAADLFFVLRKEHLPHLARPKMDSILQEKQEMKRFLDDLEAEEQPFFLKIGGASPEDETGFEEIELVNEVQLEVWVEEGTWVGPRN